MFGKSQLCLLLLAAVGSSAFAGERFFDFEEGSEFPGLVGGSVELRPAGGVNDSGYLKITDANDGERGVVLVGDVDDGSFLVGFRISVDLRVGAGADQPAHGLSFNFASADDPAISRLIGATIAGNQNNPGLAVAGYADVGDPDNSDMPEEGTTTGLAIGFDEFFSGSHRTNGSGGIAGGSNSDPVDDVVGISVRLDNNVLAQVELPTLNGLIDDATSLQTGPVEDLDWANLTMDLAPGSNELTVIWKDAIVYQDAIDWTARAGAFLIAGRTGASSLSNHHIDNLEISTIPGHHDPTCEFDGNGFCDLDDLNALMYIGIENQDLSFDLDVNGVVDLLDRDEWFREAESLPGDADLDGVVNSQDLNAVGSHWQGTGIMSYADGDFNGDGLVDSTDLNELGIWWTKTAADFLADAAPQASTVPEPGGLVLFLWVVLALLSRRRTVTEATYQLRRND